MAATLAPRVTNVAHDAFPADQIAIWDHIMASRNLTTMANLFAMMAHSPGGLGAVAAVGEHVRFYSVLDEVLRELVICTVAQVVGNHYEWCHHIHRIPDDMRAIVGTPAIEEQAAPVGPALTFARLAATGQPVADGLIEALRAALGDTGLVELTIMVGYYQLIGTFCTTLAVPLEAHVADVPFNR